MAKLDILPDSRTRVPTGSVRRDGQNWVPVYCANCGKSGGVVPETDHPEMHGMFYLCVPCSEKHGYVAHLMAMPDEVFFQRIADEQLERYGRLLGVDELLRVLDDPSHPLTKLVRERAAISQGK